MNMKPVKGRKMSVDSRHIAEMDLEVKEGKKSINGKVRTRKYLFCTPTKKIINFFIHVSYPQPSTKNNIFLLWSNPVSKTR